MVGVYLDPYLIMVAPRAFHPQHSMDTTFNDVPVTIDRAPHRLGTEQIKEIELLDHGVFSAI
jgi:hypothetical protein